MTSQDKFLRRLLACIFAGSSILAFPGCGMTSRARQEPDHVYSTTTPQMLEQQSRGEPVPVQATYPEEAAAVPKATEEGVGVARIPSQQPAPVDLMKGHASAGKVQLVSWQAEQVEQECPPGFYPAEPRVECDPNGPPIYRRETVAWSSLAEMYPDEYVYDGGDGNYPASVHTPQRSGIETEDTVAGFTDHTGDQRTAVSNRVAVYAPRFGSVRTVTTLSADTKVDKAVGARDALAVGNFKTGRAPHENVHDTILYGVETRDRVDGMNGAMPPAASQGNSAANQNRKVDEGHEGRYYAGTNTFNRRDRLEIAEGVRNAITWTRDQYPVISASTSTASQVQATFKAQQTVGVEDQRKTKGNLLIIKLADREEAQSGDVVKFTIRFQNTGDFDVYDVKIVDNLTSRLQYVDGSATIDESHPGEVSVEPNGEGSSVLTFTLDAPLKGHASGTLTFEAQVR